MWVKDQLEKREEGSVEKGIDFKDDAQAKKDVGYYEMSEKERAAYDEKNKNFELERDEQLKRGVAEMEGIMNDKVKWDVMSSLEQT